MLHCVNAQSGQRRLRYLHASAGDRRTAGQVSMDPRQWDCEACDWRRILMRCSELQRDDARSQDEPDAVAQLCKSHAMLRRLPEAMFILGPSVAQGKRHTAHCTRIIDTELFSRGAEGRQILANDHHARKIDNIHYVKWSLLSGGGVKPPAPIHHTLARPDLAVRCTAWHSPCCCPCGSARYGAA